MEILSYIILGKPLWMWAVFISIILILLVFDLGVLHRKQREISIKESLYLSLFYIIIALLFGVWVWHSLGLESAEEYLTGFIVEKTLALDNVFIISLIFTYFAIPRLYQHRVLFWGIIGVIVLRAIMIGLGTTLVSQFSWILYLFAVFLIATGIKMLIADEKEFNIENNLILKFLRKKFRVTDTLHGNKFTVKLPDAKTGKKVTYATPLLIALVLIELVDLIFAVDSIPAIFSITLDPYIVYTSNIFAILGLRALFFALAAIIHKFVYLKQALACVLVFIGSKTFIAYFMDMEKFPAGISLGITVGLIFAGIIASIIKANKSNG